MTTESLAKTNYLTACAALAATITRNQYGDYSGSAVGSRFVTGRGKHTRLPIALRAKQVDGWRKGMPQKSTGYVVTDEVLALYDAYIADEAAQKKLAAKQAVADAAKTAGLTVSAWKKQQREAKAKAAAEAEEKAVQEAKEDEAAWLKVVTEVLTQKDYAFTPAGGVEKVLNKIADNEGVGRSWNNYDFDGGRHAFVRCVLGAADRHENSNYDNLLRAGYDREDALNMRERF